jgi:hypothetical protein
MPNVKRRQIVPHTLWATGSLIGAAILAMACNDSSAPYTRATTTSAVKETNANDGDDVSIETSKGIKISLNVKTGVLSSPKGKVKLPNDVASKIKKEMLALNWMDSRVKSLETSDEFRQCVSEAREQLNGSTYSVAFTVRKNGKDYSWRGESNSKAKKESPVMSANLNAAATSGFATIANRRPNVSYEEYSYCHSAAIAIADFMPAYRAAKDTYADALLEYTAALGLYLGNPTDEMAAAALATAFVLFEIAGTDLTIKQVQMGYLGTAYSIGGCWSNNWADASSGGGGGGGGTRMHCELVWGTLEWTNDSGSYSWSGYVSVCGYDEM